MPGKASLALRLRSKMRLKVSKLRYTERRQAVWSKPLHIYTLTNAHRSIKVDVNEDNLLQKSYTQPGVRLQRLGVRVEDPVLQSSARTCTVSQQGSTAARTERSLKRSLCRQTPALPFSDSFSRVSPPRLSGLSGRLQRVEARRSGI